MSEESGADYTGPFYIELTSDVRDPDLVRILDELSAGIIRNLQRPGVTIWEFPEQGSAFKGVLILQKKEIPFTLTGRNDLILIEKVRS